LTRQPYTVLLDAQGHVRLAEFAYAVDVASCPGEKFK
jgi:hypothetical protein